MLRVEYELVPRRGFLEALHQALKQGDQVGGYVLQDQLTVLQLRDIQQVFGQSTQPVRCLLDLLYHLLLLCSQLRTMPTRRLQHQGSHRCFENGERLTQFMGRDANKLVFEIFRMDGGLRLLQFPTLSDIPMNL